MQGQLITVVHSILPQKKVIEIKLMSPWLNYGRLTQEEHLVSSAWKYEMIKGI